MAAKEQLNSRPVNLRMRSDTRALIDRAARIRGKNRSEFMIDAAVTAAENALMDQSLLLVDEEAYQRYLRLLDEPPPAEGAEHLNQVKAPWGE